MQVFISYARNDRSIAESVRRDLTRALGSVWIDDELTGGQAWWDTILLNIRTCDLFVFLLSPDSLRSRACQSELRYALQSRRPLLPVMVAPVSVQLAPREIADTQIVDYRERTADSAVALITAASRQPAAPPTPDPLPESPPPPLSYMNPYREQIQADGLPYQEQTQLMFALKGHLHVEEEQETARGLLMELRKRPDIVESVGREIDDLLRNAPEPVWAASTASPLSERPPTAVHDTSTSQAPPRVLTPPAVIGQVGATPPSFETRAMPPPSNAVAQAPPGQLAAEWRHDPTGRYEYRYWDGARWTDHVSRGGTRGLDAFDSSFSPPVAAFKGGALTGMIIATLLVSLVGIIVGAINLKHPARRGQAQILLFIGIASTVFWFLLYY